MSHFDLTASKWTKKYSPCNGARYLGSTQSQRTWNPPSCVSCPSLFTHTPAWWRYSLPTQTRQLVLLYFRKLSPEYCPGHRHSRTRKFSRSKVRGFLQYLYRVLVHLAPVLDIPWSIQFSYLLKLQRSVKRNFRFSRGLVAAWSSQLLWNRLEYRLDCDYWRSGANYPGGRLWFECGD